LEALATVIRWSPTQSGHFEERPCLRTANFPGQKGYNRGMEYEWDRATPAADLRKHGVSFAEAATVFGDPLAITFSDPDRSVGEYRYITFGLSHLGRLLVVSHAQGTNRSRIINARLMTRYERRIYEED
jgi:hypothetical protein